MKAIILAGGYGSRISEETDLRPKPMIEIGDRPILWHILKHLSHYKINEFIICLGYKGYIIKEYFINYLYHVSDLTISLNNNEIIIHKKKSEDWKITLIDTGADVMTGGRLKRVEKYLDNESFLLTYGDGLSNINIDELIKFHKKNRKIATISAVFAPARFGSLKFDTMNIVNAFEEKPLGDGGMINGGFFILEKKIFEYLSGDDCVWEQDPLKKLVSQGNLAAFIHKGFWAAMDTIRDKRNLNDLWNSDSAPWKVWID